MAVLEPQHRGPPLIDLRHDRKLTKPKPYESKKTRNSPKFADWVKRRVDTDTANLSVHSFEVDSENCLVGCKVSASKALLRLTPLEAMSGLYQTVFQIYLRKDHAEAGSQIQNQTTPSNSGHDDSGYESLLVDDASSCRDIFEKSQQYHYAKVREQPLWR